ncbi:hypothetical protein P9112_002382 [Eukaryota sp. TZLM1-RC]
MTDNLLGALFTGDLDAELAYSIQICNSKPPPPPPPRQQGVSCGLDSSGASCFVNAALQLLYHITPFRNSLLNLPSPSESSHQSVTVINALRELFAQMHCLNAQSIYPQNLFNAFKWSEEDLTVQHDSQEFFRLLFDSLSPSSSTIPPNYQAVGRTLSNLFSGEFEYSICCDQCGSQKVNYEQFCEVILSISTASSLESMIEHMSSPEFLEEYVCDCCNQSNSSSRSVSFSKLPQMFSFVLNRFSFDWNSEIRRKSTRKVSFPNNLIINNEEYHLFGFVVHEGGAYGGHYKSYIINEEVFVSFDDCNVEKKLFDLKKFFSGTECAYMLFYANLERNSYNGVEFYPVQSTPLDYDLPSDLKELITVKNQQLDFQRKEFNSLTDVVFFHFSDFIGRKVSVSNQFTITEAFSLSGLSILDGQCLFLISEPVVQTEGQGATYSCLGDYTSLMDSLLFTLDKEIFFIVAPLDFWESEGQSMEGDVVEVEDNQSNHQSPSVLIAPFDNSAIPGFDQDFILDLPQELTVAQTLTKLKQTFHIPDSIPLRLRSATQWVSAGRVLDCEDMVESDCGTLFLEVGEAVDTGYYEVHCSLLGISTNNSPLVNSSICDHCRQRLLKPINCKGRRGGSKYNGNFSFPFTTDFNLGHVTFDPLFAVQVNKDERVCDLADLIIGAGFDLNDDVRLMTFNQNNWPNQLLHPKSTISLKSAKLAKTSHISIVNLPIPCTKPLNFVFVGQMDSGSKNVSTSILAYCSHIDNFFDVLSAQTEIPVELMKVLSAPRRGVNWKSVRHNSGTFSGKSGDFLLVGSHEDPHFQSLSVSGRKRSSSQRDGGSEKREKEVQLSLGF